MGNDNVVSLAMPAEVPWRQAYSKVLIFRMAGGSVEASVGFGWPAGDFDPSCWRVVGRVGEDAGRPAGLRTRRIARCRAPGRGFRRDAGAQPDGGFRTASRASRGRAA